MAFEGLAPVLGYSMLPALGAAAGALAAEKMEVSRERLSLALHAAMGVVMGVVAVELVPRILSNGPPAIMIALFFGGGLLFLAVDRGTAFVATLFEDGEAASERGHSHWVLAVGIGFDFITDGILIGVGSSLESSLGLLLGMGLLLVDIPEGLATMASLKQARVPRQRRLAIALGLAASIPLGGLIGWLLRGAPDVALLGIVAVTAGMLATLVVEEMAPTSHRGGQRAAATILFLVGFALFAFLTVSLG